MRLLPLAALLLAGPARVELWPPDELWAPIVKEAGRPLGYSHEEMLQFRPDRYVLATVENLFRDVRAIPRFSGGLAEQLVAAAKDPAELVRIGFSLTDANAARNLPLAESKATAMVDLLREGIEEATPWLRLAFARMPPIDLGAMAVPWVEERQGQLAASNPEAFHALDALDRRYLAFGSAILVAHVKRAVEKGTPPADPGTISTPLGDIVVTGPGNDEIGIRALFHIDLGGDDRYLGTRPNCTVIDLGRNDAYEGESVAAGVAGVGIVWDLGGDDRYRCRESALGCGWWGTGLLVDAAGNDRYEIGKGWGQGAAHAGVGVLVDLAGNDEYVCAEQSQGLGSTLGCGILLDLEGNDRYVARDDGNISELYLGQSVAMAQGCGYGRRADLGDGHSLAGGVGVLVDGAGDDSYGAMCWAQGCGYWWALGILEDLAGNDVYRNGKYSLGAAAHFAIGCQVDLNGEDRYNVGNATAVNQFQGHARDGSIGVSIDGGGDDRYLFRSHCAGSADLNSFALFWDRAGDDRYEWAKGKPGDDPSWADTPPMGSATLYEKPFRNFRDDLDAVGVFLDTGGKDSYPEGEEPREGGVWIRRRGSRSLGYGVDHLGRDALPER
jgi:hypothetical protein